MISSHVDDFILAETGEFMEDIRRRVEEKLDITKLEDDMFRFNGIDVFKEEDRVIVDIQEYVWSLEKLEVTKGSLEEEFTAAELKVYRKYTGKLSWLASKGLFTN